MSTPILPFAVWLSGTNQNSIPANDNSLRHQILNGLVISKAVTAQPGSPSNGDIYIIPGSATGAQWSTFDEDDLVIYSDGTWYAFAPADGVVVNFDGSQEQWSGGSNGWVEIAGGGGGGAVDSVNGLTGTVVLDADDIDAPDPGGYFTGTTVQDQLQELGAGGGAGIPNKLVNIALSDLTTALTTGTLKGFWIAPEDGEFVDIWLGIGVVQSTSGIIRIDVNEAGSTIFTTRPYIDANEATSLTGGAAVFTSSPYAFTKGDIFTFDIDDAGTSSKGLQAVIEYTPV